MAKKKVIKKAKAVAKAVGKAAGKAVAKVSAQAPVKAGSVEAAWIENEGLDSRDIIISKALIMQGQSDFVLAGNARSGEIRDSRTGNLIAGLGETMRFVTFKTFKTWIQMIKENPQNSNDNFEWLRTIPFTDQNADMEWDFIDEAGVQHRNDKAINHYAILVDTVLHPKDGRRPFPIAISFRRTGYKAGSDLATYLHELADLRKPPAACVFELRTELTEKNGNKFYVPKIKAGEVTPDEVLEVAFKWFKTFRAQVQAGGKIDIDESDVERENTPPTSTPQANPFDKQAQAGDQY